MSSPQQRLSSIAGQLAGSSATTNRQKLLAKNADDVVITLAVRTPLTKAKKGGLKNTNLDSLLVSLLTTVREKSKLDPNLVEDVCVGNCLCPGQAYVARSAVLAAGYPVTAAASVANRFCSSGLLAIQNIANQIIAGSIDVGIAVGAESMSTNADGGAPEMSPEVSEHPIASQNKQPMGQTSENVAGQFSITRQMMDEFAARSYQKAEHAQKSGWFNDEIVPVKTQIKDPKTGEVKNIIVDRDDGIRYGTTAESLGKIRAAFPQWKPSQTTGGNASQITDGAAAVLLMKRSRAQELGQPIVGKFCGATVTGLEPRIMGIGPSYAIPKILSKFGLTTNEIDIFEINEAFASMGAYCVQKLELDEAKVNPRGGAIAFGHPLGATGARQVVTALSELRRQNKRVAVTSMCVGTKLDQKLNSYTPLEPTDKTKDFLRDFFKILPPDGKKIWRETFQAQGGKTPTEITPSPRSGVEDSIENLNSLNIEPISRSSQSQLRHHCLERDGNKCLATGQYSHSHPHPQNAITTHLEAAHIIPFALGSFQANDGEAVDRHAKTWVNLRRYFPVLRSMSFTSDQINTEKNILMLESPLHTEFGQFRLIFEATGVAHQYRIKTFPDTATGPIRNLPKNRLVKFRIHKGSWELPDPKLLGIHACIGNFLHLSGQAEIIDKVLKDFEDCGGLAPSGSTNIEDLLAASGLSLLSSNVNETPDSRKSTDKQRPTEKKGHLRAKILDTENKPWGY
ncbi:hypothetical protein ARAM_001661 [Aspergillus rambellii]|uniref:Uncharacterized protein n=1 Tax=Aspergillus rambellii TaxID=308745 RepID=A0A0F8USD7_9EURO|nr:hypothetical protein ARAM_001661 [Aspergillus rambellii]